MYEYKKWMIFLVIQESFLTFVFSVLWSVCNAAQHNRKLQASADYCCTTKAQIWNCSHGCSSAISLHASGALIRLVIFFYQEDPGRRIMANDQNVYNKKKSISQKGSKLK